MKKKHAFADKEIEKFKEQNIDTTCLEKPSDFTNNGADLFEGAPKKIRIISNRIFYGPSPNPNDIVEQRLTINDKGRVWYSIYKYGDGGEEYEKAESKIFKIDKGKALEILDKVVLYIKSEYIDGAVTDVGMWNMIITNTEGMDFYFGGSLCGDYEIDGVDICKLIRDALEMEELYLLDGKHRSDRINRIAIDYRRCTKIKPKEVPEGVTWEFVTWDYAEKLIIDRETETIEHIQNIGTGCKVSHKYEIEYGIESLLDDFDTDYLFGHIMGNPPDVVENPNETKDYTIIIDYKKNPQRIISGTFDKNGLPYDFEKFANTVFSFMEFYGMGEILNPSVYKKVKRRKSDYIFCSVNFGEGYKTYYYLTEDDSIEVGDCVFVPAGKDNHGAIVDVVKIEYFSEENAPLPIEKTKRIIRKCTEEDFDC